MRMNAKNDWHENRLIIVIIARLDFLNCLVNYRKACGLKQLNSFLNSFVIRMCATARFGAEICLAHQICRGDPLLEEKLNYNFPIQ